MKELEEREAKAATSFGQQETKSFNQNMAEAITEATDDIARFARKEQKSLII